MNEAVNVTYLSLFRSKWKSHPYTLGSYSFIPIGATAEDVDTMGEPVTGTNSDKVNSSKGTREGRGLDQTRD